MTVDITTGEVMEFDRAAAERRAERIVLRLDAIAENYTRVLPLITEAIAKRDDIALGYRSPGDYVQDRFGQALAGLGVDVRRAVVGELTQAGLSTRAIAPVVGVSQMTVVRDAAAESDVSPQTSTDSTGLSAAEHVQADVPASEQASSSGGLTTAPAAPPVVTGIDGKTYVKRAQPAPKPRRQPIDAIARTAARDMETAIDTLGYLADDDRFDPNKDQMAEQLRGHLNRAIETCQGLLDRINS